MAVGEVVGALKPPGLSKVAQWRLAVSLTLSSLVLFAAWTLGVFSMIGFPGFARADKLDLVVMMLQQQKINDVEKEIRAAQESFCVADGADDDRARSFWIDQRETKRREYFELTRAAGAAREYPLPSCEDLGVRR